MLIDRATKLNEYKTKENKEIEKSLDWVRSLGVRIDPVGGDVVEG